MSADFLSSLATMESVSMSGMCVITMMTVEITVTKRDVVRYLIG